MRTEHTTVPASSALDHSRSESRPFSPVWPILRTYQQDFLDRIALPIGGIGTGTVSLGGRGDLRDWEIMNRPAKGFIPVMEQELAPVGPFLAVWARREGESPEARLLEGPYPIRQLEGQMGATAMNHGMPRFSEARFAAAYPLGQVALSDSRFPLQARIEAFNPFVPANDEASSWPAAVIRVVLQNPSRLPVEAALCFNLPNFVGDSGEPVLGKRKLSRSAGNRNTFRSEADLRGLHLQSTELPTDHEAWGDIALATTHTGRLTWRTNWAPRRGGDTRLEFWDDFTADGALENFKEGFFSHPAASLCPALTLEPGQEQAVTFILTWRFPNRRAWTKKPDDESPPAAAADSGCCGNGHSKCHPDPDIIGNHYATRFADAWGVLTQLAPRLPSLEKDTVAFARLMCDNDLPDVVREAALFNLSTLRSQTVFRAASGYLCAYEGCNDHAGCCHGSCTHVWNYETATAALFGQLARTMREVEFGYATLDDGRMLFRASLPFWRKPELPWLAADGQMGCLVKLYREWQRCGDDAFLRRHWPRARKALEFCWIPGGWDADRDGVMEGCQHNTMDVEYFGPNPQMTGWYLAALRAAEEMARHLGQTDFASTCRQLFDTGSAKADQELFNGEFYEHHIIPPASANDIADGLQLMAGAASCQDPTKPFRQIGPGCLVDQLVGHHLAGLSGLGPIFDLSHVRKTLASIFRYNFRQDFRQHFNHLRSYVAPDESGLLMATWPRGGRPEQPFPYCNEVMTGFEYTAAAHMIAEGMETEGLACIRAIRARYDGQRRNPFDEAECGHHYGRAMAAWGALEAWTGFRYSAVTGEMRFLPREGRFPWASGNAWGEAVLQVAGDAWSVKVQVLDGQLSLQSLVLEQQGKAALDTTLTLQQGDEQVFRI